MHKLTIHEDIRQASTLPGAFYRDPAWFALTVERVFTRTWHFVADHDVIAQPGQVFPFTLLPGVIDEPLLLTRDHDGQAYCLSNVCTHRGKVIVTEPGTQRLLRCGYHGRCFRHDGRFRSMPAFEETVNFPTAADNLPQLSLTHWHGLQWVSMAPHLPWSEIMQPIHDRLSWFPFAELEFDPESSRDFRVAANWALYVDNYLEGFHIPFVHPALNNAIEFGQYSYEQFATGNLQVGIAEANEPAFDLPADSPDHGRRVYAYYYWIFPNLMFNFYPWGLSLNIVEPLNHQETRIKFRTYRLKGTPHSRERNQLDQTEFEDEAVVESVQQGIQSRYYQQGRFSVSMEPNVHHFHRLLAAMLA